MGQVSDESEVDGIKAEHAAAAVPEGPRASIDDLNAKIKPRTRKVANTATEPPSDDTPATVTEPTNQPPAESLEDWANRTDSIAEREGWAPDEYEAMRREAFSLKEVSPWTSATPAQRKEFEDALSSGKLRLWWQKKTANA